MDDTEEEPPSPDSPFWLSARARPKNPLLNTGLHVVALSVTAIVLMAVVTPSLLSQTHRFFRPSSVKRGWDSINLVLVVFAIVCGFLGRNGDNSGDGERSRSSQNARLGNDYSWRSYGDEGNVVRQSSLRRASSSYPDLIRQEMMWNVEYDQRPRFYDDSYHVNRFGKSPRLARSSIDDDVKVIEIDDNNSIRMHKPKASTPTAVTPLPPAPPPLPQPRVVSERARKESTQEYEGVGRRIRRDGQGRRKSEASKDQYPPQPPPPPPPPSQAAKSTATTVARKASRQEKESNSSGHRVKSEGQGKRKMEPREASSAQPPPSPPPPPPPPPPEFSRSSQKKRGATTKEIITSIYQQTKRKNKQNRRSHENLQDLIHRSNPNPLFPPPSPPPPPPPPPPPSFFQNIFSAKKGKSGRKSLPLPPPPPPPPPRRLPPPQSKPKDFDKKIYQMGGNGSQSPLIPIPPPPPFKVPPWKFVVQGDYVNIRDSPLRDGDDSGDSTPTVAGNTPSPLFPPSPDVNIKADDFIARFRANLKLEKMNSLKHHKHPLNIL